MQGASCSGRTWWRLFCCSVPKSRKMRKGPRSNMIGHTVLRSRKRKYRLVEALCWRTARCCVLHLRTAGFTLPVPFFLNLETTTTISHFVIEYLHLCSPSPSSPSLSRPTSPSLSPPCHFQLPFFSLVFASPPGFNFKPRLTPRYSIKYGRKWHRPSGHFSLHL